VRDVFRRTLTGALATSGAPVVGSGVQFAFHALLHPGAVYVGASSLGYTPGLPVDDRVLPLNADALFLLSLSLPAVWEGFVGVLDGAGFGTARINLPAEPGLAGFTFYTAFLALDAGAPSGIGWISGAAPITIVP